MGAQSPTKWGGLVEAVCRHFIDVISFDRLFVAYSGGMDSHVLLHALAMIYPTDRIYAVHVNHQQSPLATEWVSHTRAVCEALGVHYILKTPQIHCPKGASLECVLRDARYAAFAECMTGQTDTICLAHHADDQAETVLMRLLRGSGPSGLGAMRESRPFATGQLCRPFLSLSRAALHEYAVVHHLKWIEDESNQDQRFDRNYLRQSVMPVLKARWPSLEKTLSRAAHHCREMSDGLAEVLRANYVDARWPLPWGPMRAKDQAYQALVVRQWLMDQNRQPPVSARLMDFLKQLDECSAHALPVLHTQVGDIRYYRDHLYFLAESPAVICQGSWDWKKPFELGSGLGRLRMKRMMGKGVREAALPAQFTVRVRNGQTLMQLPNTHCHQSLKNLWQRFGVPPWLRSTFPLVFNEGALLAMPGFAWDGAIGVAQNEMGWAVVWEQCPYPLSFNLLGEEA